MPVPGRTGCKEVATDMQQIIEQIMIRNRNEACQQAYNHADKIEPRIHQLQLPNMPAANSFSNSLFSETTAWDMFCYLHFPTTNSPLRSSEPISYYIYFTSQPFRKYKKTSPLHAQRGDFWLCPRSRTILFIL